MSRKQLSAQDIADLILVCRRLAAALQSGEEIVPALDAISAHAPPGPAHLLHVIRQSFVTGSGLGRGLIPLGFPTFMWLMIEVGEITSMITDALSGLADRLAAEQATSAPRDRRLYAYSLAFGRLGLMLKSGVPVIQAVEAAAESVGDEDVQGAFMAVRDEVREGMLMANAFAKVADDLPPMVIEMIADTEVAGRLDDGVSIISDYLLDEAGEKRTRGGPKEAHNA